MEAGESKPGLMLALQESMSLSGLPMFRESAVAPSFSPGNLHFSQRHIIKLWLLLQHLLNPTLAEIHYMLHFLNLIQLEIFSNFPSTHYLEVCCLIFKRLGIFTILFCCWLPVQLHYGQSILSIISPLLMSQNIVHFFHLKYFLMTSLTWDCLP